MLYLLLSLVLALPTLAQTDLSTVSGQVVDENGEPMVGATVSIKGTDISVPTDIDGKFILNTLDDSRRILIRCIGYTDMSLKPMPDMGVIRMGKKGNRGGLFGVGIRTGVLTVRDKYYIFPEQFSSDAQSKNMTAFLFGAFANYSFSKRFRVGLGVDYAIGNTDLKSLDLDLDLNLTIGLGRNFVFYPLLGVGYSRFEYRRLGEMKSAINNPVTGEPLSQKIDQIETVNKVLVTAGGGLEYYCSNRFTVSLEAKGRLDTKEDYEMAQVMLKFCYLLKN